MTLISGQTNKHGGENGKHGDQNFRGTYLVVLDVYTELLLRPKAIPAYLLL